MLHKLTYLTLLNGQKLNQIIRHRDICLTRPPQPPSSGGFLALYTTSPDMSFSISSDADGVK